MSLAAPRLLLVDDDRSLVDVLSMTLEDAGFVVRVAHDGRAGWRAFCAEPPDLVVLDLLMPELDGLGLAQLIRERHTTPIVMLTSRAEEMDTVLGLELGADDYVTKPFSARELVARIRAALRRVSMERGPELVSPPPRLEAGELVMDRVRHEVHCGGTLVQVTATEFELLWALAEEPGRVLSRDGLIDRVYGEDVVVTPRTIDTFVKRLRAKLGGDGEPWQGIETVRSVGYRLRDPRRS